MPMSDAFKSRLFPRIRKVIEDFGTPFHIYDEAGIIRTGTVLKAAFSDVRCFREYYAVKALPNLRILMIMREMGFGFDCSSIPELLLAQMAGASGEDIIFTSNNTSQEEYAEAARIGCILNLDDIAFIPKVPLFPELICFRYNPGERRTGNAIIGNPIEAKYGVRHDQIVDAYRMAIKRGARRFGLHTMIVSNQLDCSYMVETVKMVLEVVEEISRVLHGIKFEFVNIGGGIGIPYKPDQPLFDINRLGAESFALLTSFEKKHGYQPKLFMESGRYMTGPHGVLATRVINRMSKYREYAGVDACMSALPRPAIYGAYHHITVLDQNGNEKEGPQVVVDVVGSLCENWDKFAIQRALPQIEEGDILVIQETGAHSLAMGATYNGRLRPQELLLTADKVELIRRAETPEDYFSTLYFVPRATDFCSR